MSKLNLLTFFFLCVACFSDFTHSIDPIPDKYTSRYNRHMVPGISKMAWSKDQKLLVAFQNEYDKLIHVFDGQTYSYRQFLQIKDTQRSATPTCMAFSYDNKFLIIGTKQGGVYGYQIQNSVIKSKFTYKQYTNTTEQEILQLDFSIQNKIAVTVDTGDLLQKTQIWEAPQKNNNTFQKLLVYMTDQPITSSVWSIKQPQYYVIADVNTNQKGVKWMVTFFDLSNIEYYAHVSKLNTSVLAFSPDGEYLYQGSPDSDVTVYKYANGNASLVTTIPNTKGVKQIKISSNNRLIALSIGQGQQNKIQIKKVVLAAEKSKNQNSQKLQEMQFVDQLTVQSKVFAFSNLGDQFLIINDTSSLLVPYWGLCDQKSVFTPAGCIKCNDNCDGGCIKDPNTCWCTSYDYFNGKQCVLCAESLKGCYFCNNQGTSCSDCQTSKYWHLSETQPGKCTCLQSSHRTSKNSQSECVCEKGFFDRNHQVCGDCLEISPGCQQCQNQTACVKCENSFTLDPVSNKCMCIDSQYLSPDQKTCKKCSQGIPYCTLCKSNQQVLQCQKCSKGFTLCPHGRQCECLDGVVNPQTFECQETPVLDDDWLLAVYICGGTLLVAVLIISVVLIKRHKRLKLQKLNEAAYERMRSLTIE